MSARTAGKKLWRAGLGAGALLAALGAAATGSVASHPRAVLARALVPKLPIMIVGRTRVLFGPRSVAAVARTVRVGRRRCRIPARSPLAALAAARRAGAPNLSIRDYGSCSRSARDAAGLFVYRIGPDSNRGRAGWVYKIDARLGTGGASDPRGPFGGGRGLRSGQRLLWFWCTDAVRCQRTLAVFPAANTVRPGELLPVTVVSYDDRGKRAPAAGARVMLGTAAASTDSAGRAEVPAPRTRGAVSLRASASGLVPAFPVTVSVTGPGISATAGAG